MIGIVVTVSSGGFDGLRWDVCQGVWKVICADGIWNVDVELEVEVLQVEIPELEEMKVVEWASLEIRYSEEWKDP